MFSEWSLIFTGLYTLLVGCMIQLVYLHSVVILSAHIILLKLQCGGVDWLKLLAVCFLHCIISIIYIWGPFWDLHIGTACSDQKLGDPHLSSGTRIELGTQGGSICYALSWSDWPLSAEKTQFISITLFHQNVLFNSF